MSKWTRIEDGYKLGSVEIFDNGGGLGPSAGSGRWALVLNGKWIANVDTLAEAKQRGEELTKESA